MDTLTPIGEPPSRSARWCPACGAWMTDLRGRRRCHCGAAVVRPRSIHDRPKPGELRPGVIAEFSDPRDRYDPTRELHDLRARLMRGHSGKLEGKLDVRR